MKLYVASSWKNGNYNNVVRRLIEAEHEVYNFKLQSSAFSCWIEIDQYYTIWTGEEFRNALKHDIAKRAFMTDFNAMKESDGCVLVNPSGRSAHLEAGWFVGQGKPVFVLLAKHDEPELMYSLTNHLCISIEEVLDEIARCTESKGGEQDNAQVSGNNVVGERSKII